MSTLKFPGIVVAFFTLFSTQAVAEQILFVDFKNARLLHYYGDVNVAPDEYAIVLPKYEVQGEMDLVRPIHGVVTQTDHKPTWWPTAAMRERKPSLPTEIRYGEANHPIGLYRIRVDWSNPVDTEFWREIRIHGGAKVENLHRRLSAGCVRMLDEDIEQMVNKINRVGGEVRVTFMPPQFL